MHPLSSIASTQTGHTGSIIAGYSGPVTDSANLKSKSVAKHEETPNSEVFNNSRRKNSVSIE